MILIKRKRVERLKIRNVKIDESVSANQEYKEFKVSSTSLENQLEKQSAF